MRDSQREQWESDPLRSSVQSNAWNRLILIWSIASPIIAALLVLGFVPDWNWKGLTAMMMLAFASASALEAVSWMYEHIKYRKR
jgi:hypothetical protein